MVAAELGEHFVGSHFVASSLINSPQMENRSFGSAFSAPAISIILSIIILTSFAFGSRLVMSIKFPTTSLFIYTVPPQLRVMHVNS